MTKPSRQPATPRNFEEPARIVEGMVQETKGVNRGRYRQTKAAKLENYANSNHINEEQKLAGEWYEEQFQAKERAGRDSTDLDRIASGGAPAPVTQIQADAIKKLMAVDSRLQPRDRAIIQMVCGKGFNATEAVAKVTGEANRGFAMPRFREAMENLVTALSRARSSGWTFDMRLHPDY